MLKLVEESSKVVITNPKDLKPGHVYKRFLQGNIKDQTFYIKTMARETGVPPSSSLHDYWIVTCKRAAVSLAGYEVDLALLKSGSQFEQVNATITVSR